MITVTYVNLLCILIEDCFLGVSFGVMMSCARAFVKEAIPLKELTYLNCHSGIA